MYISPVLNEESHHFGVTTKRCRFQRCIVINLHICAMLDEQRDHISVTNLRRFLQRKVVIGMHVGAVLDEESRYVGVAVVRCHPQGLVGVALQVYARANKQLHRLDMSGLDREIQRVDHCRPPINEFADS
jgi:hypothetical protein